MALDMTDFSNDRPILETPGRYLHDGGTCTRTGSGLAVQ